MSTFEHDRATVLALHKEWWEANTRLEISRMRPAFAEGDAFLMFNLNGHPYFSVDELATLWEYLQPRRDYSEGPTVHIMRLDVGADMAYLCAEAIFPTRFLPSVPGAGSVEAPIVRRRIRATEIYRRDDGAGEPRWRMTHFHCSPLPASDEPRPAFGDTGAGRGLGRVPGRVALGVVHR